MDISKIIPYEKNARHNEKAIPAVADSIKRFGFKGSIVLESRNNPVIVNGHTRVAACKSLGWTEFPDEYIVYADDLSEDDIKALRLADNKTAEIATWNIALLKNEMKSLGNKLDMSKYGFKMPDKTKPYGSERKRTNDYYNLSICNIDYCDEKTGMPVIAPCFEKPEQLVPFNYALSMTDEAAKDCWLHFFIDDYQFERLWNTPDKYIDTLKRFAGVLSPDFSLYMDMPYPMQAYNEYRRRALMSYWQRHGIQVIPTLSWSTPQSYEFCFTGIPKGSTVAISSVGIMQSKRAQATFTQGLTAAIEQIQPKTILLYGASAPFFDFGDIEVIRIKARSFKET